MKNDAAALGKLSDLIDAGFCIQLEKVLGKFEITLWQDKGQLNHNHFSGHSLVEAVSNIKDKKTK